MILLALEPSDSTPCWQGRKSHRENSFTQPGSHAHPVIAVKEEESLDCQSLQTTPRGPEKAHGSSKEKVLLWWKVRASATEDHRWHTPQQRPWGAPKDLQVQDQSQPPQFSACPEGRKHPYPAMMKIRRPDCQVTR